MTREQVSLLPSMSWNLNLCGHDLNVSICLYINFSCRWTNTSEDKNAWRSHSHVLTILQILVPPSLWNLMQKEILVTLSDLLSFLPLSLCFRWTGSSLDFACPGRDSVSMIVTGLIWQAILAFDVFPHLFILHLTRLHEGCVHVLLLFIYKAVSCFYSSFFWTSWDRCPFLTLCCSSNRNSSYTEIFALWY